MAGPWEKYGTADKPEKGPWSKHGTVSTSPAPPPPAQPSALSRMNTAVAENIRTPLQAAARGLQDLNRTIGGGPTLWKQLERQNPTTAASMAGTVGESLKSLNPLNLIDMSRFDKGDVAGGIVGTGVNIAVALGMAKLMSDSAVRGKPLSERVSKLTYAAGPGGSEYTDFPKSFRNTLADLDKAAQTKQVTPSSVKGLADLSQDALRSTNTEYGMALQPIAGKQVVPTSIADSIRARITPEMAQTRDGRILASKLKAAATEYEKPWSLRQLDLRRETLQKRLRAFYRKDATAQATDLRTEAQTMADREVVKGIQDIVYSAMDRANAKPDGYYRGLKSRQSQLIGLSEQLQNHATKLSNITQAEKGRGAFNEENVSVYGHPGGRIGMSIHRLQRLLVKPDAEADAGKAVKSAFKPRRAVLDPLTGFEIGTAATSGGKQ